MASNQISRISLKTGSDTLIMLRLSFMLRFPVSVISPPYLSSSESKKLFQLPQFSLSRYLTETYVGLATNFKERYRNHKTSFRHSNRRNETKLPNMFGTCKMPRNRLWLSGKFLRNVNLTATLPKSVVFVWMKSL